MNFADKYDEPMTRDAGTIRWKPCGAMSAFGAAV
jgi:hypothetical protein